MKALRALLFLGVSLPTFCGGCVNPVGPQRAQETAYQYAMGMRFGQSDGLLEFVHPPLRSSYSLRYARWRRTVRFLDLELTGVRLKSADEANVLLVVGWSRANETTLRTTVIAQTWRSKRSQWFLCEETDVDGDAGLFDSTRQNSGT